MKRQKKVKKRKKNWIVKKKVSKSRETMVFPDSHCHFSDNLNNCNQKYLQFIQPCLLMSFYEPDWYKIIQIKNRIPTIFPAFGYHPWLIAKNIEPNYDNLHNILNKHQTQ
jgi:Tat protein secretion system quality control protein TatD with DNase activity